MGPLVDRRLSPQEFLQECCDFKREHAPRSAFVRKLMALYVQFLDGLGVSLAEVSAYLPLASTLGAAAAMGYFCHASFEEGLGAFGLAVEMQVAR